MPFCVCILCVFKDQAIISVSIDIAAHWCIYWDYGSGTLFCRHLVTLSSVSLYLLICMCISSRGDALTLSGNKIPLPVDLFLARLDVTSCQGMFAVHFVDHLRLSSPADQQSFAPPRLCIRILWILSHTFFLPGGFQCRLLRFVAITIKDMTDWLPQIWGRRFTYIFYICDIGGYFLAYA